MRYSIISASAFLAIVCLAGCGGGGGNSGGGNNGTATRASSYAGTYVGTYENASNGSSGPLSFTVLSAGGTISNGSITIGTSTLQLMGSITNSGVVTFAAQGSSGASGTVSASGAKTIYGTLTDPSKEVIYLTALANPTGPATGNSSFSNDYSGTYTNTTKGETGILSFHVDSAGNISGTVLIDSSGTVEFATLGGTIASNGAVTYSASVNGSVVSSVTGNLTLSGTSLTGSMTNSKGELIGLTVTVVQ